MWPGRPRRKSTEKLDPPGLQCQAAPSMDAAIVVLIGIVSAVVEDTAPASGINRSGSERMERRVKGLAWGRVSTTDGRSVRTGTTGALRAGRPVLRDHRRIGCS